MLGRLKLSYLPKPPHRSCRRHFPHRYDPDLNADAPGTFSPTHFESLSQRAQDLSADARRIFPLTQAGYFCQRAHNFFADVLRIFSPLVLAADACSRHTLPTRLYPTSHEAPTREHRYVWVGACVGHGKENYWEIKKVGITKLYEVQKLHQTTNLHYFLPSSTCWRDQVCRITCSCR